MKQQDKDAMIGCSCLTAIVVAIGFAISSGGCGKGCEGCGANSTEGHTKQFAPRTQEGIGKTIEEKSEFEPEKVSKFESQFEKVPRKK